MIPVLETAERTILGFRTMGSIYILDNHGRTTRFQYAPGEGQGEWHPLSHCIFVKDIIDCHIHLRYGGIVEFCYLTEEGGYRRFPYDNETRETLPRPDLITKVSMTVTRKKTYEKKTLEAFPNPEPFLYPVEKNFPPGYKPPNVYIGSPITQIFKRKRELDAALAAVDSILIY